ncbi:MAG: M1 family metallopeptidase [Isosphaeraceae bacterium]|nr:M1 family metallopeptidase [Isosphaeraceae bacterium]
MSWLGALGAVVAGVGAGDSPRRDMHSFANPEQVRVRHVALNLQVDFGARVLAGSATLHVERQPGAHADAPLVLDTKRLTIEGVEVLTAEQKRVPAAFSLGKPDPILGAALTVNLPPGAGAVTVNYRTAPEANALQWLDAPRTAGGKQPFLFTQSEAIHARTWIPLQDSPGVRVTYEATIKAPPGMTALMSAEHLPAQDGAFRFKMTRPIPSYLIALAVGDLPFRPLGARSGVYAEPPVVQSAAFEFADTEAMIATIEKRYGPYLWGRYDLLVLPPSFPFGGMENPLLTFATPTILAGDRSLVSLVAHELAHSWSGNLVTNATWSDFWLNEGFTVYIERRAVEDLYGPEQAAMESVLGLRDLREALKKLPPGEQVLHIDLAGRDPDDAVGPVAYEKGALFLTTLEHAFGRDRFDPFLRAYFDHFAFQSITTADFVAYLRAHLLNQDAQAAAAIDLDAWLSQPGLPPGYPEPKSARFEAVALAAREWVEGKVAARDIGTKAWSTHEWIHFLQALPESLPAERLAELDAAFGLTARPNAEVVDQWLLMAIRNQYHPADERVDSFLTKIGRRKYLMPLYGALIKTPEGRARAEALFAKARPFYHPITADSVARLLGIGDKP